MKKTVCLKTLGFLLASLLALISCDMSYEEPFEGDAATPRITAEPQGGGFDINEEFTLEVTAEVSDGDLSYQWYSYARHQEYETHTGKIIQGATDAAYTASFDTESINHFYVIVTNTNSRATGRRMVSVRSQPVTVVVNDPSNARYPVIQVQPVGEQNIIWRRSMDIKPLMVTAVSEDDGELSYQWYITKTLTNENGDLIEGAVAPLFAPLSTKDAEGNDFSFTEGNYYFFVVVFNTNNTVPGRRISSVVSSPVLINIIISPNADVPVITEHPSSEIIFIGENVSPLTVAADEPEDGGVLSYQWYSHTTSSNEDGTAITDATGTSYTPVISTGSAGNYYYYVVVTNTNTFVTNPISTVTSRVAELVVTSFSSDAEQNPNATITVNMDDKLQFIRGFGGQDVAWGNFPDYKMSDYETMFNPDKLGYNIVRIQIPPDNIDINATMYDLITNQLYGADRSRENYYEFVKLVNRYNGYVLASPWSPPREWKTNNSKNGGGSLRATNYQDYAYYLRSFAQHMSNNGAPIYAISIQNEPNYQASGYDGCEWEPNQMRDFFKQVGRFTQQGPQGSNNTMYPSNVPGFGGGRVLPYVLTVNGESANTVTINNAALNDPDARKYIDLLARHIYGERSTNLGGTGTATNNVQGVNAIYDPTDPREVWMTEFNLNSQTTAAYPNDSTWNYLWQFLNTIDVSIRNNHESAYVWWSMKRFYSMIGDNTAGTVDGEVLPRGWGMAHFSKFAKETYRVGVTYSGTLADRSTALATDNINPGNYTNLSGGAQALAVKVMAFVRLKGGEVFPVNWKNQTVNMEDITEINLVMYTPTETSGSGGHDMGKVKVQLPDGFTIRGVTAMRSTSTDVGNRQSPKPPVWETVDINRDRNVAYISMPRSQVLSVRFTR